MLAEKEKLEIPTTTTSSSSSTTATMSTTINTITVDKPPFSVDEFDIDSACSTPYVSAPSSPGRGQGAPVSGFYYSAPASPMHFMLSSSSATMSNSCLITSQPEVSPTSSTCSFEFDFSASKDSANGICSGVSMSSADELFLNGQIRPMKLSTHLQRPQVLGPLLDLDEDQEVDEVGRGRDARMRDRSLRRRTRSMSPLRTTPFGWHGDFGVVEIRDGGLDDEKKKLAVKHAEEHGEEGAVSGETTPCESNSGASSRSSSVGRSSSRWVFLKEFLYRSKSEGRNNGHKFWGSLSFSPVKDKIKMEKFMPSKFPSSFSKEKIVAPTVSPDLPAAESSAGSGGSEGKRVKHSGPKDVKKKAVNGVGKRRVPPSPHELHYTANRAQAEEMRKKTFLPYRQGLLGCLGFSSKSYGAMNGFARALNPVSSRR